MITRVIQFKMALQEVFSVITKSYVFIISQLKQHTHSHKSLAFEVSPS